MTSSEVKEYYDNGKIPELYKKYTKYLNLIDQWADKMIDGDLLNEYDLKYAQQQLNGCQTKINSIAGAFSAILVEYENNYIVEEDNKIEKIRPQDHSHCKAVARSKVSDIRRYASDFTRYVDSAQSAVITIQSLLKRQTIEKSNKGVDWTGERPVEEQTYSGDPQNKPETTKWD